MGMKKMEKENGLLFQRSKNLVILKLKEEMMNI
jgi:hypothetical protein